MFKGVTSNSNNFHRPEGAGNFDNMDDVNIVQSTSLRQGTIDHTPTNAKDIVNKEYVDSLTATVLLNEVGNPDGDKEFTMSNKLLGFRYTAPTPVGDFGGAFEIEASGGFTGDLFHVHQHTGNPGAGVDLIHAECDSANVTPLRITSAGKPVIISGGQLNMSTQKIINVVDPTADQEVATKKYVDDNTPSVVWGGITGTLSDQTDLQSALDLKADDNSVVHLTGNESIAGIKTFTSFPITPTAAPDADYEVANKKYVDDNGGGSPGGSNNQVQINSGGTFFADDQLIMSGGKYLSVGGGIDKTGVLRLAGDGGNDLTSVEWMSGGSFVVPNDPLWRAGIGSAPDKEWRLMRGSTGDASIMASYKTRNVGIGFSSGNSDDITTPLYVLGDTTLSGAVFTSGGIFAGGDSIISGALNVGGTISDVTDPTTDQQAATKKYVDDTTTSSGACFMETGTYTGDGTTSHVISLTDAALVVKKVEVYLRVTSAGGTARNFMTTDTMVDDIAAGAAWNTLSDKIEDDRIIAVGTGSFTVDDNNSNTSPNGNGALYNYVVWGTH